MGKAEFRREVFKEMCNLAEFPEDNLYVAHGERIDSVGFKPTLSDKLIFHRILDKVINNIYEEYNPDITTPSFVAYNVLHQYYFPEYNYWDELELKKARD